MQANRSGLLYLFLFMYESRAAFCDCFQEPDFDHALSTFYPFDESKVMHSYHDTTKDALPGGNLLKGMIIKVTIMFMALTTFCVFLRLAGKLRTGKRRLVVDDYSMLTAWVCRSFIAVWKIILELTSCLQFFYILLSCLALNVALLERHNPILTLPVADKLLLVSHELPLVNASAD
jgi:hypothetical protein